MRVRGIRRIASRLVISKLNRRSVDRSVIDQIEYNSADSEEFAWFGQVDFFLLNLPSFPPRCLLWMLSPSSAWYRASLRSILVSIMLGPHAFRAFPKASFWPRQLTWVSVSSTTTLPVASGAGRVGGDGRVRSDSGYRFLFGEFRGGKSRHHWEWASGLVGSNLCSPSQSVTAGF